MHSTVNHSEKKVPTKRDLLRIAKERGVRFVRLGFADISGTSKSIAIPAGELERALEGRITFDGGSIDGFVRGEEVDMILRPDPSSFAVLPWTLQGEVEARLLCDIATPDGAPFEGCARTTLRRVLEDARDVIEKIATGLEIEFYLFPLDASGSPSTLTGDTGSYFDFSASDRGEEVRTAIVSTLEAMGIAVAGAHHEHGSGQHEIDLLDTGVLATADNLTTFRAVTKQIATKHGLHATFMPKPLESQAGSGLHIYVSLRDATGDAIHDAAGRDGLSDVGLHAVGGLLAHAPACTAIYNPTVNSYKRLVAAWDAPIYTVWSHRSANALVRIPTMSDGAARIEVRSPDPSCNPYLAMAVLVESIADGVRSRLLPGDSFTGSTYELADRTRTDRGIRTLPKSLRQAIAELDSDAVVRGALGDHIYHAFRDAKLGEYERYRRAVHPWEHEAYLRTY